MRIWAAALAPYGRHSGVTRAVSETPCPNSAMRSPFHMFLDKVLSEHAST